MDASTVYDQISSDHSHFARDGGGEVTNFANGTVTHFAHDDGATKRQLQRSIDRRRRSAGKWTKFDPDNPAVAIGCDIKVRGVGSDTSYAIGRFDHATKRAYCYKDVSHFHVDGSRPTVVPYDRIVSYDASEDIDGERAEYLSTDTARKDFSRSNLDRADIVWCPLADDAADRPADQSVNNATTFCAAHPDWRPVLGYELDVCQCGKHATSWVHGVVKRGAEYKDITPRAGFAVMSGMRFFVPDPRLRETDLLYARRLGWSGAFEGRDRRVFDGPGTITFTPSDTVPCPNGIPQSRVVHNVVDPCTGQTRVKKEVENWQITRRALLRLHDNEVRLPQPGARPKAVQGLRTRVRNLRIAACSECKVIDITHTANRLCGACVGELPEDAFAKLKANAEERERLEHLVEQLREAEEAAKKARGREQAALDAEAGVQRRVADARPTPQSTSKKKGKAANRATRRAENRLTAEEVAFDVDKNPAYVEGKARDRKLCKECEAADLLVETVKAAIKAERLRIAEVGARLEAARHAIPEGPTMADYLARALMNGERS